jgi:hypothetical protein
MTNGVALAAPGKLTRNLTRKTGFVKPDFGQGVGIRVLESAGLRAST